VSVVVVVLIVLALSGAFSKGSFFDHFRRISRVTTMMQEFTKDDWRQLYAECAEAKSKNLANSGTFTSEQWPPMIRKLNPHFAQFDDDTVYMTWTGGFDDFNLWLWVLLKDGPLLGTDAQCAAAGIWIVDSRKQSDPFAVFLAPSHAKNGLEDRLQSDGDGRR
jgi:hypothetical protein